MMKPILYVMVGLPASGKSTFLNFVDDPEFADTVFVYSTDMYIENVASSLEKTYDECFSDYIHEAQRRMDEYLRIAQDMGVDIYWDQTNLTKKKRQKILHSVSDKYVKKCICFLPPQNREERAEHDKRLLSRKGKTIPAHILDNMRQNYEIPSDTEGFDEIIFLNIYGKKEIV